MLQLDTSWQWKPPLARTSQIHVMNNTRRDACRRTQTLPGQQEDYVRSAGTTADTVCRQRLIPSQHDGHKDAVEDILLDTEEALSRSIEPIGRTRVALKQCDSRKEIMVRSAISLLKCRQRNLADKQAEGS